MPRELRHFHSHKSGKNGISSIHSWSFILLLKIRTHDINHMVIVRSRWTLDVVFEGVNFDSFSTRPKSFLKSSIVHSYLSNWGNVFESDLLKWDSVWFEKVSFDIGNMGPLTSDLDSVFKLGSDLSLPFLLLIPHFWSLRFGFIIFGGDMESVILWDGLIVLEAQVLSFFGTRSL